MQSEHHPWRKAHIAADDRVRRANDALTDLSAYALSLDIEYHRLDERLRTLAAGGSCSADVWPLLRERHELAEELMAYRRAIKAYRDQVLQQ
jgi:hypothetical protein